MFYKKIFALIFMITLIYTAFFIECYAEEEKPDNTLTTKIEGLISKDEEGSLTDKIKDASSKVGDKFEFKKIDPEKIVSKTEEAGDQLYLIAQAYSWPLFIWSIILGFGSLTVGGVFGSSWLKKAGIFFLFVAFLRVIIINYAPELVSIIINWIEGVKGG